MARRVLAWTVNTTATDIRARLRRTHQVTYLSSPHQSEMELEMITGMSTKTYLSVQHLQSAAYLSARAARLEKRIERGSSTDQIRVAHLSYVTSSILASVAFIEALGEEVMADARLPMGGEHLRHLVEIKRDLIAVCKPQPTKELPRTLVKFNSILLHADCAQLDYVSGPAFEMKILISVRNRLVHYVPSWFDAGTSGQVRPGNLASSPLHQELTTKFPPRAGATVGGLQSDAWMGAGCTKWAVQTALDFSDAFFERLGIESTYAALRNKLPRI